MTQTLRHLTPRCRPASCSRSSRTSTRCAPAPRRRCSRPGRWIQPAGADRGLQPGLATSTGRTDGAGVLQLATRCRRGDQASHGAGSATAFDSQGSLVGCSWPAKRRPGEPVPLCCRSWLAALRRLEHAGGDSRSRYRSPSPSWKTIHPSRASYVSSRHVAGRRLAGGEAVGAGPVGLGRVRPTP